MHCSNCGEEGHNKNGCDKPPSSAFEHQGLADVTHGASKTKEFTWSVKGCDKKMAVKIRMGSKIMLFHGGKFQRVPELVYCGGEGCEVDCDPDFLSVGDLMEMVEKKGYPEENIKKLHFVIPGCSLDVGLVAIEGDNEIRNLMDLLLHNEYVCVYVEHVQENLPDEMVPIVRGHEIEGQKEGDRGDGDADHFPEEDGEELIFREFSFDTGSDVHDEALEARKMTVQLEEAVEAEREAIANDNAGEVEGEQVEGNYHDSHNADSLYTVSDERDKEVGGGKDKKHRIIDRNRKRKKRVSYGSYNPGLKLEVGMVFPDKKSCKKAVYDYRITGGYKLRVTKSDKERLQLKCAAEGCQWRFWASKVNKALSFEIKTLDKPHTCIPNNFQAGQSNMSTEWLAEQTSFRRPEAGERPGPSQGRVSRIGKKMHCSNCGEERHNKNSCDKPPSSATQHQGRRQRSGNSHPPNCPSTHQSQSPQIPPQPHHSTQPPPRQSPQQHLPPPPPPPSQQQQLPPPLLVSPKSPHAIQPSPSPETSPPATQPTQPPSALQPQPTCHPIPPPIHHPHQPEFSIPRPSKLQVIGGKASHCKKKPRMTTTPSGPLNCNPPTKKDASKEVCASAATASARLGSATSAVPVKASPKLKLRTKSALSWFNCSSSSSVVSAAVSTDVAAAAVSTSAANPSTTAATSSAIAAGRAPIHTTGKMGTLGFFRNRIASAAVSTSAANPSTTAAASSATAGGCAPIHTTGTLGFFRSRLQLQ